MINIYNCLEKNGFDETDMRGAKIINHPLCSINRYIKVRPFIIVCAYKLFNIKWHGNPTFINGSQNKTHKAANICWVVGIYVGWLVGPTNYFVNTNSS